ncbi:hypothetical protein BE15_30285 [Sorangium cellulosum]|uniref:Uncharacterized protein n=1 Tax=Sorangium cellulosum TaxID=56 RepID=A0A150QS43_SORCE|nr:hypothetical protein BE15_30285 [Sorangium cellulosum]
MTTGRGNGETTRTTPQGSGRPRRPTREHAEHSYELSSETLREAVLELLRLAVEYETPHAPMDPHLAVSDRAIRVAVGKLSGTPTVLKKVVQTVLRHRDERRKLVKQVRTAQALREVADLVRKRRQKWNSEQADRKRKGLPSHSLNHNEPFRRELTNFVRSRFAWWEVPLPSTLLTRVVDAAVPRSTLDLADKDEGLLRRLANVVGHEVTDVGPETLEKTSAALGGRKQRAGHFKRPLDARCMLDDEPVGGSEMLGYLLRLLASRGLPERLVDAVMKVWNEELLAIVRRYDAGAPPSPESPTDPS